MANSKQLHILATRPAAYADFMTSGRLPRGTTPAGPLVDLLNHIQPRYRAHIRGVTIGPARGYNGSHRFATAEQALRWVCPDNEVHGSFPADSWQLKTFHRPLHIEDLLEHCASWPETLLEQHPRLRRPQPKHEPAPQEDAAPKP
jgi:hypothetical protein